MKTVARFREVLARISYKSWHFHVGQKGDVVFLQVRAASFCNVSGAPIHWAGRKWILSPNMSANEIVQTAFKAVLTAEEHEARELFLYLERAVFDPHFDLDELWVLRGNPKARKAIDFQNQPAPAVSGEKWN